ncbi:MAG: transposase [Spartobacteria bacterium]|nr:transposase [Spartobacteria bacterium]
MYNRQRVAAGQEPLSLFACRAHARRYFYKAEDESGFARWMLRQVQLLYRVDTRLRESNAGPALRAAVRQAESTMILQRIEKALKARKFSHLSGSLTGQAVVYTLRLWDQLVRYTQDGRVEIDNNLVENAIRPTAVGKKNWLFFGSENAGWQSAVLFSILETCRKLEINPQEYLLDVLTRLPHMTNQQVRDLTPSKWRQTRMKIAC